MPFYISEMKGQTGKTFSFESQLHQPYIYVYIYILTKFLLCTKAIEALFLLGYFSLTRKLCSLRSWLQTVCDSSIVTLLLPVLKMTHGNKQSEPRA